MTYALLVEIAWKSVVTSGLALLLLALLRNRTAGERSWIAHAGLLATLLLPLAVIYLPDWAVEAPAALPGAMIGTGAAAAAPEVAATAPQAAAEATALIDFWALSFWAYALCASLLLLATLVAVLRLFALRRRASVLVEQPWLSALAHAQRRMGFKHGTALLVSDELASPVSWGILRPIILLNQEAVASHKEAEAIIAHELAHVARLDWAKLLLARAATAIFWFNPLVWVLARQCHQLREEAADDAVLRSNVPETDYAALLVGAARHENNGVLLAAHGVAPGRGSLKRRVTRILDTTLSRAPARAAWVTACSAGAVLISAPLSALTPVTPLPAKAGTVAPPPIAALASFAGAGKNTPAVTVVSTDAGTFVASAAVSEPAAPATATATAPEAPAAAPVQLARSERLLSPDTLIQMKIHGVTPEYVQELAAISPRYANLPIDKLVAFRIHGVTPSLIRELAQLGYRDLTHAQLTSMAVHGVKPAWIREMAALGYRELSVDDLVAMKIHGVTPDYIRHFREAGYDDLSARELVNMRIHGVRLDDSPPTPPRPPEPPAEE